MKKFIKLAVPVFLTLYLTSCATMGGLLTDVAAEVAANSGFISHDTADMVHKAVEKTESALQGFTVEQEYTIGRGVASSILATYPLYENEELTMYVNLVLQTLVSNSETLEMINGYHAAILDTDVINAFATSGGHILVTRGLINCTKSEDELACVLAHELAHIQLCHNINAISSDRKKEAGKIWANALVSATADNISEVKKLKTEFNAMITSGAKFFETGYPQAQEFAADKKALELAAAAGYNPKAMDNVLDMLEATTSSNSAGFGKNHPKPQDRKKNLKNQYNSYPANKTEKYRTARFDTAMNQL